MLKLVLSRVSVYLEVSLKVLEYTLKRVSDLSILGCLALQGGVKESGRDWPSGAVEAPPPPLQNGKAWSLWVQYVSSVRETVSRISCSRVDASGISSDFWFGVS